MNWRSPSDGMFGTAVGAINPVPITHDGMPSLTGMPSVTNSFSLLPSERVSSAQTSTESRFFFLKSISMLYLNVFVVLVLNMTIQIFSK